MKVNWKTQIVSLEVLLAVVAAALIFTSLDLVSGGLLMTVIIVAVGLIVMGLVNYLVWGRRLQHQNGYAFRQPAPLPPLDEIVVSLSERERTELLRLLGESLKKADETQRSQSEAERTAIDRELADKLRMFGA